MAYTKTWKCKNCSTMLTWKLPYEAGTKPYEFEMVYGKVRYIKEHWCKKRQINELPKVFSPNTPDHMLCGICNNGIELISCDSCVLCKIKPTYCLTCKDHPKLVYFSNSNFKVLV